jgi:hypothetical protein
MISLNSLDYILFFYFLYYLYMSLSLASIRSRRGGLRAIYGLAYFFHSSQNCCVTKTSVGSSLLRRRAMR